MLLASIEFVSQLLTPGFDGSLDIGLLSIDIDITVFIAGVLTNGPHLLGEFFKYLHVLLRAATLYANLVENSFKLVRLTVKGKKMPFGVPVDPR